MKSSIKFTLYYSNMLDSKTAVHFHSFMSYKLNEALRLLAAIQLWYITNCVS